MADALAGIRVLDMTIWQQGTYSTAMLADLGADVIKVEGPDAPDPGRGLLGPAGADRPLNAYFESHNRSKRGIVIDLKHPKGREVLHRLVETADVFVSNMRLEALRRLGADYETLRAINPRLVYGRASGYGPEGPDADLGSMDIMAQARGGLMSVTGEPDDPPLPAGFPVADHVGAMGMAFAIMVALFHRERTGEGQQVDASLLGGQLCIQSFNITGSLFNENRVPPRKRRAGETATWNVYQGSDGKWFVIGMSQQRYWPGICEVIGRPEWLADEPYGTMLNRRARSEELMAELDRIFASKTADEWVRLFSERDLMAARVNDYAEVARDPQNLINGYIQEVERGNGLPPVRMVGPPVNFASTPARIRHLAPEFDQHTEEVLLEAGYSWEELEALRKAGAIGMRPAAAK
jgi:crotonobetainyl-CoA:carnitine CoA-transferase CaiB-like acyl-CoA transferase